jgi:hypothetical protein
MTEVFVPIIGYEGLYEVSNIGRVKALAKMGGTNYSVSLPERIKKAKYNGDGYHQISLCKNSIKKHFYLHVLVAKHFVDNPNNYPEVNHENGDKNCNGYWNLKWCTRKQNEEHAWATGLKNMIGDNHALSKRVLQMDMNGNVIKEWVNGHQAMKDTGYSNGHISRCCRGLANQAYGYKWTYA